MNEPFCEKASPKNEEKQYCYYIPIECLDYEYCYECPIEKIFEKLRRENK